MSNGFDMEASFQKLMHFTFPTYQGKRIEKVSGGYKVFDITHPTWEGATKAVDQFYENFPIPKPHCQRAIEGKIPCINQCDHCREYFKQLNNLK